MRSAKKGNKLLKAQQAMFALESEFSSISTGLKQIPKGDLTSYMLDTDSSQKVIQYHRLLVKTAGPLYKHFLASILGVGEEISRIGAGLIEICEKQGKKNFNFFELDAFDGSNGCVLANQSSGRIRCLSSSPNAGNAAHFTRLFRTDPAEFVLGSYFSPKVNERERITNAVQNHGKLDFLYETAALQFYGAQRNYQICALKRHLKQDGIAFFLQKMLASNGLEFERREFVKDMNHKARYFTEDEIYWKKKSMLHAMHQGMVPISKLVSALKTHFRYVFLIWSSVNFYEFAASDSVKSMDCLLRSLQPISLSKIYEFEENLPRAY